MVNLVIYLFVGVAAALVAAGIAGVILIINTLVDVVPSSI